MRLVVLPLLLGPVASSSFFDTVVVTTGENSSTFLGAEATNEHLHLTPFVTENLAGLQPALAAMAANIGTMQWASQVSQLAGDPIGTAVAHFRVWQRVNASQRTTLVLGTDIVTHPQFDAIADAHRTEIEGHDLTLCAVKMDSLVQLRDPRLQVTTNQFFTDANVTSRAWMDTALAATPAEEVRFLPLVHAFGSSCYWITPAGAAKLTESFFPLTTDTFTLPVIGPQPQIDLDRRLNGLYGNTLQVLVAWPPPAYIGAPSAANDAAAKKSVSVGRLRELLTEYGEPPQASTAAAALGGNGGGGAKVDVPSAPEKAQWSTVYYEQGLRGARRGRGGRRTIDAKKRKELMKLPWLLIMSKDLEAPDEAVRKSVLQPGSEQMEIIIVLSAGRDGKVYPAKEELSRGIIHPQTTVMARTEAYLKYLEMEGEEDEDDPDAPPAMSRAMIAMLKGTNKRSQTRVVVASPPNSADDPKGPEDAVYEAEMDAKMYDEL